MLKRLIYIVMALALIVPVFAQAGERVVTVGGNRATRPITDFGINMVDTYYVDAVNGDDGRAGKSPETAFATLDYAIGRCTANQGDTIYLMPNSDETVSEAGGVAVDVAGIRIIGLGFGADRPTFTFSAVDATMTFSAASTSIENVLIAPSIDSVVSPIVVSAPNVKLDVEVRDASAAVECVTAILTTAAADNLDIKLKYRGYLAGNACVSPIRLVGVDTARIDVDFYGEASTAVVEFHTTACHDINIRGTFYNDNVALTKNVVDTVTGSTWFCEGWDGRTGTVFTASSAKPPATLNNGLQMVRVNYSDLTGIDHTNYTLVVPVTEDVLVRVVGVVQDTAITSTSGTTTLSVGTLEDPDGILGATTVNNTQFAASDVWVDTSPANDVEAMGSAAWYVVGGGANIYLTPSASDILGGALTLYIWWQPLYEGHGYVGTND